MIGGLGQANLTICWLEAQAESKKKNKIGIIFFISLQTVYFKWVI